MSAPPGRPDVPSDGADAPPRPDPARRVLGLVVLVLAAAALVLWVASRGSWLTVTWADPLRGRVVSTAAGVDTEPVLVAWALLALAAIAGVLATSGWGRRLVGVVVVLAGLVAVWRSLTGLVAPSPDALPAVARRPGSVVAVDVAVGWPLLATLGALLLVAAGAVVTWRAGTLPRLGARYDAPGTASPTDADAGSGPTAATDGAGGARPRRPADPDQQLWDALDEGRDPTVGPEPGARRGGQT